MALYCPLCQRLYENERKCPKCLFYRLREITPGDPVLLGKYDYMRAEILKGLLAEAEIPFNATGGVAGAFGMSTALRLDEISIFVPFGALEKANELSDSLYIDEEALPPEDESDGNDGTPFESDGDFADKE
ncbi:MAG: hypothetical protein IJC48_08380 [Clostridia bacterium]|nr:hypothetical protein [Clostridia bacterium]